MTLRLFICTLTLGFAIIKAQSQTYINKDFQLYAKTQDSLMTKAYDQRDPKSYTKILGAFTIKYEKLSKEDKAYFSSYYTNSFYNLCCTYSLLNDKPKALEYLEKSVKAGYSDYAHTKVDTDLDNIRNEETYKKILQPLRETGDYLYIIKKAGQYNNNENRELPKFSYQSSNNPNLVALRKAFNLDSIAGFGNQVSRILNLMHWIHNLVPHDGSHENPAIMNAMSMIAVCKKESRGLNCRGLATVLNECYLAMGFESRFVTCLPKDSLGVDNDCHVINMVYSTQLKKWLWIDPTFDAYVMNEKGELLGIEEVRDKIINDKPLILNPEANWNHKVSETKESYLYTYMAKNLYLLECPLSSEYDTETRQAGKSISYMQLIPLDYFKKSLETSSSTNSLNKTTFIKFKTNNINTFWQAP
jgi:hypothetical protein